jgi:drug/metabolite transporter (DMT)-like permease
MTVKGKVPWTNFAAVVVVNLLWAAQYPAYKVAGDQMGAAALNFWTLLFALITLLPFWFLSRRAVPTRVEPRGQRNGVREFLLLGLLGIIPPSVLLSWGIGRSSASNGAILSLTVPLLMTGMAIVFLGEKLTKIRGFGLMLGLLGTLVVSTADLAKFSLNPKLLLGNFVIVVAALGSAFYNTYSKDLLARYSEVEILVFSYLVALIACALISVAFDGKPFYVVTGYGVGAWIAVLVLGTLSWGLAMVLWMWALNRLEVGQISTSIYLLPFFGLLLSILTVGERVSWSQMLGGCLAVIGTATLTVYEDRRAQHVTQA